MLRLKELRAELRRLRTLYDKIKTTEQYVSLDEERAAKNADRVEARGVRHDARWYAANDFIGADCPTEAECMLNAHIAEHLGVAVEQLDPVKLMGVSELLHWAVFERVPSSRITRETEVLRVATEAYDCAVKELSEVALEGCTLECAAAGIKLIKSQISRAEQEEARRSRQACKEDPIDGENNIKLHVMLHDPAEIDALARKLVEGI